MRRLLYVALALLMLAGIVLVAAVTAAGGEPSRSLIWGELAGLLAALIIILILEFQSRAGRWPGGRS